MSIMSKVRGLLPTRRPLEERVARKRAGVEARRQIMIDKADVAGTSHEQVTQQRGNLNF